MLSYKSVELMIIVCPPVIFLWYAMRFKKHSACLNRKLVLLRGNWMFQIVGADRVLSAERILAFWHVLGRRLFSLSSLSFSCSIWLIEQTSCRPAISTDVHKLSVTKWLFDNIAFTAYAQGPVGHYRAITSEILVWTSGGKLMCYCDERFSLWGLQQEPIRGDRIN